jgi:hypothetical protein
MPSAWRSFGRKQKILSMYPTLHKTIMVDSFKPNIQSRVLQNYKKKNPPFRYQSELADYSFSKKYFSFDDGNLPKCVILEQFSFSLFGDWWSMGMNFRMRFVEFIFA